MTNIEEGAFDPENEEQGARDPRGEDGFDPWEDEPRRPPPRDRRQAQGRGGPHPHLYRRDGYLLWRIAKEFSLTARVGLRAEALSWDGYLVLVVAAALVEAEQIVIVERTGLDRMRVTRAADELEDEGLVTRGRSRRDRRSRTVTITATGMRAVKAADARVAAAENEVFARLTEAERAGMTAAFTRFLAPREHPLAALFR